jgi:hypothetical protein
MFSRKVPPSHRLILLTQLDAVVTMQCTCLPRSRPIGIKLVVCISYCAVVASLGDNHSVTSSNSEAGTTDTA